MNCRHFNWELMLPARGNLPSFKRCRFFWVFPLGFPYFTCCLVKLFNYPILFFGFMEYSLFKIQLQCYFWGQSSLTLLMAPILKFHGLEEWLALTSQLSQHFIWFSYSWLLSQRYTYIWLYFSLHLPLYYQNLKWHSEQWEVSVSTESSNI